MPNKKSRLPLAGRSSRSVDPSPFFEERAQSNQQISTLSPTPPPAPTVSVSPAATLAELPDSPQPREPRALLQPPIPIARPRENSNETLKANSDNEECLPGAVPQRTMEGDSDDGESEDPVIDLLYDLDDSDGVCWLTGWKENEDLDICFLFDPHTVPPRELPAVEDLFTELQLNHAQHSCFSLFSQPNAILLRPEICQHFVQEGSFVVVPCAQDRRAILLALANANSIFREEIRYGNLSAQRQLDVSCEPFVDVRWEVVVLKPSLFPPNDLSLVVYNHGAAVDLDPPAEHVRPRPTTWTSSSQSHHLLSDDPFLEPMSPFWRPTNRFECNEPSTLMMCLAAHDKLQAYVASGSHRNSDLFLDVDPLQPSSFMPTPGMVREGEISEIADEMKTIFGHIFDVDPPQDVNTVLDLLYHLEVISEPEPSRPRLADRLSTRDRHPADSASSAAVVCEDALASGPERDLRCDTLATDHDQEADAPQHHVASASTQLVPTSVSQNEYGETTFHYPLVTAGAGSSSRSSTAVRPSAGSISSTPASTSSSILLPEGTFGSIHPIQNVRQDATIDRQLLRCQITGDSGTEHYEAAGVPSTSVTDQSASGSPGRELLPPLAAGQYQSSLDTVLVELHKLYDAFREGGS